MSTSSSKNIAGKGTRSVKQYNNQVTLNRVSLGLGVIGAYFTYKSIQNIHNNGVYAVTALIPLYGVYKWAEIYNIQRSRQKITHSVKM